ncbi:hypothetical protein FKP32DRAFT_1451638 [Trametes sanguinea]|nr:hypothetical protein FKP32DRAFT_1451638 [Trametes sanguinea]
MGHAHSTLAMASPPILANRISRSKSYHHLPPPPGHPLSIQVFLDINSPHHRSDAPQPSSPTAFARPRPLPTSHSCASTDAAGMPPVAERSLWPLCSAAAPRTTTRQAPTCHHLMCRTSGRTTGLRSASFYAGRAQNPCESNTISRCAQKCPISSRKRVQIVASNRRLRRACLVDLISGVLVRAAQHKALDQFE